MTITIVLGAFYPLPPAPGGSVERLWYDVGMEFARLGHRVTFVARAYPGQLPEETVNGVRFIRRSGFSRSGRLARDLLKDLWYSLRILPLLPKADIVVMNVFWLPALASVFRRGAGKIVLNVQRVPKRQLGLYRWCARLSAVSNAIREDIAQQRPKALASTRVIPNPIDAGVFTPPPTARKYDGEQTLLYTGRIHPEKGVHLLIDAFGRMHADAPNLKLRLVGPIDVNLGGGGPDYLADLKRRAGDLPVEFSPPIFGRPELAEAYRAAHYYCYPSLADKGESFGIAPLEAMATGLLPIVSDLACFRDFIRDGQTGYFFDHHGPGAEENLAKAIKTVVADPARTSQMGADAAQSAKAFGYDAVAKQYLADFQELLG